MHNDREDIRKLKETWDAYYEDKAVDTAIKDNAFYELECEKIVTTVLSHLPLFSVEPVRILELGSATGYLAKNITEEIVRRHSGLRFNYTGIDISPNAVERASCRLLGPNVEFVVSDFDDYLTRANDNFHIIISQRSIMAVLSRNEQNHLLGLISSRLAKEGAGIFSEGIQEAFDYLNDLRNSLSLAPLQKVWHCRYVDSQLFNQNFDNVTVEEHSSLFWLLTRVVYPYFSDPIHNTNFHRFAARLPQIGDFGLVKLIRASNQ